MVSSLITSPTEVKEVFRGLPKREFKSLIRAGKAKPDMTFLRQFPGKRRFERVSEDDWNAPLPVMDIAGFGHIGSLEADVQVWTPKKDLQVSRKFLSKSPFARKLASHSYIRNFARIMRNMFGQTVQLVARDAALVTTLMNAASGVSAGAGLIPQILNETASAGSNANPDMSGASMAVGDGVAAESHTRNDLVNRVSNLVEARNGLVTTVFTTATTTLQITTGIVNGAAASVSITEIGMFLFIISTVIQLTAVPFSTLLAYDGIASTPVASGGVIAPRYTLNFPV